MVGTRRFNGSEQLYQLLKAGDPGTEGFEKLANGFASATEEEAYKRGQRGGGLTLRPDWEACKDRCMMLALRLKFESNYDLRTNLLSTHPRRLVSVKRGEYWGAGLDGTGLNRVGQLLMQLREEIRAEGDEEGVYQATISINGRAHNKVSFAFLAQCGLPGYEAYEASGAGSCHGCGKSINGHPSV